jgi:hypothetical protein
MSKSKIIYVPQGCFAEITKDTPSDVIGLVASNISYCCHVAITNSKTGYIALCHADSITDLTNTDTGAPAWIKKAFPSGDYKDLKISIGESSEQSRADIPTGRGLTYFEQVKKCMTEIAPQAEIDIFSSDRPLYGVLITRKGKIEPVHGDKDTAIKEIGKKYVNTEVMVINQSNGEGFEEPLVAARIHALPKLAAAINLKRLIKPEGPRAFGRISDTLDLNLPPGEQREHVGIVESSDIKLKPICVFDSSKGEFIDTETIMKNDAFINPSRVRRNAKHTDESSNEGHKYYESDSASNSADEKLSSNSKSEEKQFAKDSAKTSKVEPKVLDRTQDSKSESDEKYFAQPKKQYTEKYWNEELYNKYPKNYKDKKHSSDSKSEEKQVAKVSNKADSKSLDHKRYWDEKRASNSRSEEKQSARASSNSGKADSKSNKRYITPRNNFSSAEMIQALSSRSPTTVHNRSDQIAPSVTQNLTTNDKGHHK